jgi:hypothetical protein
VPLQPIDEDHALQIQAGTLGRKAGHKFEDSVTDAINSFEFPLHVPTHIQGHLFIGSPAQSLLEYVGNSLGLNCIDQATAISTGAVSNSSRTATKITRSRCCGTP